MTTEFLQVTSGYNVHIPIQDIIGYSSPVCLMLVDPEAANSTHRIYLNISLYGIL